MSEYDDILGEFATCSGCKKSIWLKSGQSGHTDYRDCFGFTCYLCADCSKNPMVQLRIALDNSVERKKQREQHSLELRERVLRMRMEQEQGRGENLGECI